MLRRYLSGFPLVYIVASAWLGVLVLGFILLWLYSFIR